MIRYRCPGNEGSVVCCIDARCCFYFIGINIGNIGDTIQRKLVDTVAQTVKPSRPLVDERLIIELIVDDGLKLTEHQSRVGSELQWQSDIGALGAFRTVRVQHD